MPVGMEFYLGCYHGPGYESQPRLVRNNHAIGLVRRAQMQMQGLHGAQHQSDLEQAKKETGKIGTWTSKIGCVSGRGRSVYGSDCWCEWSQRSLALVSKSRGISEGINIEENQNKGESCRWFAVLMLRRKTNVVLSALAVWCHPFHRLPPFPSHNFKRRYWGLINLDLVHLRQCGSLDKDVVHALPP